MVEAASIGGGSGENKGFRTTSLTSSQWLLCLLLGFFSLIWYLVIATLARIVKPYVLPILKEDEYQEPNLADEKEKDKENEIDHDEEFSPVSVSVTMDGAKAKQQRSSSRCLENEEMYV